MSRDQDSRLKTTTVTSAPEYYDQVLALSSKIINDSWVTLYSDNDVLQSIDVDGYKDGGNKGQITGNLKPCQFYLKPQEESKNNKIQAIYKIRFDSGTLTTSGHDALQMDVSNWEIAVNVELDKQKWSKMTDDQKGSITKYYELPEEGEEDSGAGDYSVTRIFVKIIDAKINDINEDESVFTDDDGNSCKIDDFDDATQNALQAFLDAWTEIQHSQGTNTLGVTLTQPSDQEGPRDVWMNCADYQNDQASAEDKKNYRCLLWCELLPDHDNLKSPVIATRANWCYPGIDATYAVSSQVFFEKFLVEQLQPLARASELKPTTTRLHVVKMNVKGMDCSYIVAVWKFSVGHNEDHTAALDDYFKLTKVEEKPPKYTWSKTNTGDTGAKCMDYSGVGNVSAWANLRQSGTVNLTVSPNIGSNKISVSGRINYKWAYRVSDDDNVMSTDPVASANYSGTWSLSLLLSTDKDGQLHLAVDGSVNPRVTLTYSVGELSNASSWDTDIADLLQSQISDAITAAKENLTNLFLTAGKFVYPSNGLLSFTDPVFNEEGDVLASVEYKPMTTVTVPSPSAGPKLTTYAASEDKSLENRISSSG
ncbi:hypothetical protein BGW36DRAFT_466024 [Talaromyces proteolyticus]|uniref:Uncharacterized protein n=1 Tax=Talaromyces proteolyticus TaxID=1131652 RepID=A0AAD4KK51_9EURO|nr:uncharacterized protein BGW36DRAFT_466024 [Talaromyces proteolyticus]KAH8690094.1 hypothetical protein BGW36DRAFT_466024 [Talaromyces proteolyticus]